MGFDKVGEEELDEDDEEELDELEKGIMEMLQVWIKKIGMKLRD